MADLNVVLRQDTGLVQRSIELRHMKSMLFLSSTLCKLQPSSVSKELCDRVVCSSGLEEQGKLALAAGWRGSRSDNGAQSLCAERTERRAAMAPAQPCTAATAAV
ncbi:hypothetical protein WMY93_017772 [Mugilogobius chulae]|uniref:Uncharacterized protein n=1 Tax=Mugilogobius chulae TaxID=88201 RepID=A0AAW0NTV3_9GOBI